MDYVARQAPLSMGILQARILEQVAIPFSRGIFPMQGSSLSLLHCKQILCHLSHQVSAPPPLSRMVLLNTTDTRHMWLFKFKLKVKFKNSDLSPSSQSSSVQWLHGAYDYGLRQCNYNATLHQLWELGSRTRLPDRIPTSQIQILRPWDVASPCWDLFLRLQNTQQVLKTYF